MATPKKSIDYYGLLGLTKSASSLDIKDAYRRLALQYNPERQKDPSLYDLFVLVGEAYEVLMTPLLKAIYDQYGEDGLKKGVLTPFGWNPPYQYHGDPMKTFKDFFGTSSPYADLLDILANPTPTYSVGESKGIKVKEPPFVKPLVLTLEEVYHGGLKLMKIQRKVFTDDKKDTTKLEDKLLNIVIPPGVPVGTQFTFPECGDMGATVIPGDIIFCTEDKPHPVYKRDGVDLLMKTAITIEEALIGTVITVNTLDKRTLRVALTQIVTPDYKKIVEGEGMPYPSDPSRKGNLIISFDVEYPSYIPQISKKLISKAFSISTQTPRPKSPEQIQTVVTMDRMNRIH